MDLVRFQFTGGLADDHELNFYEAGRFQYGAARFIYTLEKFRESGRVYKKLNTRVRADVRIRAASEGSYIQDILIYAAPMLADSFLQCSFEAILSYALEIILPNDKSRDVAVGIAQAEVQREEQRTLQERERTQQLAIIANVANNANSTTKEALEIVKYALANGRHYTHEGQVLTRDALLEHEKNLAAKLERESIIAENAEALSVIDTDTEQKLAGQLKKPFGDIACPLRSSASGLIIIGQEDANPSAHIDFNAAQLITRERIDPNLSLIRGKLKAYDVENGYGKFRHSELMRVLNFRVPAGVRADLRNKILAGMTQEDALLRVRYVRDMYNNITSMLIDDVLADN